MNEVRATDNCRNDEDVIDLLELARVLISKISVIILCMLACGVVTYAGAYFLITPTYDASITMYVNNKTGSASDNTVLSQSDLDASAQLVNTYSAIIRNVAVLRDVIADADVDLTEGELQSAIRISAVNSTEVFEVYVSNPDAKAAARIANSIANVAPERISDIVDGSSVKVINYADIPTQIAAPNYLKITMTGMAVGFVLSVAVIIFYWFLDKTVKSEDDCAQWEYPILSTIPDLEESRNEQKIGYGYGSYIHNG